MSHRALSDLFPAAYAVAVSFGHVAAALGELIAHHRKEKPMSEALLSTQLSENALDSAHLAAPSAPGADTISSTIVPAATASVAPGDVLPPAVAPTPSVIPGDPTGAIVDFVAHSTTRAVVAAIHATTRPDANWAVTAASVLQGLMPAVEVGEQLAGLGPKTQVATAVTTKAIASLLELFFPHPVAAAADAAD